MKDLFSYPNEMESVTNINEIKVNKDENIQLIQNVEKLDYYKYLNFLNII